MLSLRNKVLLIIGLTAAALIGLLYMTSGAILLSGYVRLEEQSVRRNVERVFNALNDELNNLSATTADWAQWDDTYQFVEDGNEDYIESNLLDDTFTTLRLNLMLFVNTAGEIVFGKAVDLETGEVVPIPAGLLDHLSTDGLLLHEAETTSAISGVLLLPDGPLLVASLPILTSRNEGPLHGTLIFGLYLDEAALAHLAESTRLALTAQPFDDAPFVYDFETARQAWSSPPPIVVETTDEETITGYTLLADIYGAPALLLRVDQPRDIYAQGQTSLSYLLASLVLIGLAFVGVTLFLMQRMVLSRVGRLSAAVSAVRATDDLTLPVSVPGNDELSNLADHIKAMLDALALSRARLQSAHDDLEQRVEQRTAELTEANVQLRQEIAERQQAQINLAQARDQALEALRLKTQILANVSHDVRTPLTVIMLRTEVLSRYGPLNEKQGEVQESVLINARRLLGFFDNLLEEARFQAGSVQLKHDAFSPHDLMDDVIAAMHPLAERKGLRLEGDLADEVPPTLVGDTGRLKQILTNLVDNAIKFTREGTVCARLYRPDDSHWALEVSDTGPGIPPEAHARIFEAFWQLDGSITREAGCGVGLGLSIVKQLATLMGGQVSVRSELDCGSTFTVCLPLNGKQEARSHA